jgi:transposase
MVQITVQKRGEIVAVHRQTHKLALTAQLCGVCKHTARRWLQRSETTGDVLRKKGSGRKPIMSAAAAARSVELLTAQPGNASSTVAQLLQQEGLVDKTPHRTTVAKAAKLDARRRGEPIRCVVGKPAKRLTAANKLKRLAFAQANKRRSWASCLFTDRKKFLFSHPGVSVGRSQWVKKGEGRSAVQVNHPVAVNVYLGLSKLGCTPCSLVAGTSKHKSPFINKQGSPAKNITSQEYVSVLSNNFLPQGSRLFSSIGVNKWYLQQDNDPAHKVAAEVVAEYSRQNTANVELIVDWPPNSPDLNPIENLWGMLEADVSAIKCESFEEFQTAVVHACSSVPKAKLAKLVNSMPKRIAEVLEKEGDMTSY